MMRNDIVALVVLSGFALLLSASMRATEAFVGEWYERSDWYNSIEFAMLLVFVTTMVMALLYLAIMRPLMLWLGFTSRT